MWPPVRGDLPEPAQAHTERATRPCSQCGFELWIQIASLRCTTVGLYDDARFPGRLIVSLVDHFEHMDELPAEVTASFMCDVQEAARVLRKQLGAERVNAHLVPRYGVSEPLPDHSPWNDPRPRENLAPNTQRQLVQSLRASLSAE
jgi:hypothetical protein